MKGLILFLTSVFAAAAMGAEDIATCVKGDRTEALTYLTDGNFRVAALNSTTIDKGRPVEKGDEHYAIDSQNPNEALFAYPLKDGRMIVMAWSVDPRGAEIFDPSFRAKVLRMELLAQNGDRVATYSNCQNVPR